MFRCKRARSKLVAQAPRQICDRQTGQRAKETKWTHPAVMNILSSSCFPRAWRGGFLYPWKGIEKKTWNRTTVSSGCSFGCWWDSLYSLILSDSTWCWETQKMSLSAIVVDCFFVGDGCGFYSTQPSWFAEAFVDNVKNKRMLHSMWKNACGVCKGLISTAEHEQIYFILLICHC